MTLRLTRPEQVARNRRHLLAAARATFLEQGYAGATLDAIAERAGLTKGAVYSRFTGKPDLFLALLEARIDERADVNDDLVAGARAGEALPTLLRVNARASREALDWSRLLIEFRLVAARDPRLNERYAALHRRTTERFAIALAAALAADGRTAALPDRFLAQLVLALESGAALEHTADPAALPVELLETVVLALTSHTTLPAPPP